MKYLYTAEETSPDRIYEITPRTWFRRPLRRFRRSRAAVECVRNNNKVSRFKEIPRMW